MSNPSATSIEQVATVAVLVDEGSFAAWRGRLGDALGVACVVVRGPAPEAALVLDPSHPQGVALYVDGWSLLEGVDAAVAPLIVVPNDAAVLRGALPVALAFARRAAIPTVGASLRALVEQLPVDVWVRDAENRCVYANAEARKNWPGLVGSRPVEAASDGRVADLWLENNRRALAGELVRGEVAYSHTHPDGRYYNVLAPIVQGGRVVGTVGINLDVTESHRLRAHLARAEQLAAVGTLAAGVSHEIKNPVAYASLNLELALRELDGARDELRGEALDTLRVLLRTAHEGVKRVGALATELQSLGRPAGERPEPVALDEVVRSALRLAAVELRSRAKLDERLAAVPLVRASAARLGQVVLNLLTNALQALASKPEGRGALTVETRFDEATKRVVLRVRDDGPGLSEAVRAKLFTAFARGHEGGTGLGLYVSKHIVESYGGTLRLDDAPSGGGTVAVVELPASA